MTRKGMMRGYSNPESTDNLKEKQGKWKEKIHKI
jgi:hypothetical protein